jgi:catechol 2,3-dioxygenase-like lactoylglutathione lyase family enzyme
MGLNNIFAAILGATLVAWSGMSVADEYHPGEFFSLDLSKAVLSPKPLGPATQFAPVQIEARAERASPAAPARAARVTPAKAHVAKHDVAHQRAEKPRGAARTKLARPRGNPLDAQASDTRIQAWPCKSGGICNWK